MSTPVTLTTAGLAGSSDLPIGPLNPLPTAFGAYPVGVTALNASSGDVANATAAASLAAVGGKTNYCSGFEISGSGATAALPVVVTLTGLIGGTLTYVYNFVAGALVGNLPMVVEFDPPIPATGANVAIALSCPAGGAGAAHNAVCIHGYQA